MKNGTKKQYGAAEDMLTAFLITYAFAACSSGGSNTVHCIILFALSMPVWLWFMFRGGRAASPVFPVFTLALWVLPKALRKLAEAVFGSSVLTEKITGIFTLVTDEPCNTAGSFLRLPPTAAEAVILLVFGAAYAAGIMLYFYDEKERSRRYF